MADGQVVFEITADGKQAIASVKDITKAIESEGKKWEEYRVARIKAHANDYIRAIQELAEAGKEPYLLEELQLWYQSLLPY